MSKLLKNHLYRLLEELACGVAWVCMIPSRKAGAALVLLILIEPSCGGIGLLGALSAWYAGQAAGAGKGERPVCVFNGLLVGLYIANVWLVGSSVLLLVVLGGIFAGWLTVALGRLTRSLIKLPVLSLPFVLVAMLTSAAGRSFSALQFNPYLAPPELLGTQLDKFLSAIGNLYFMANPWAGLYILVVMLVFSRYYLLLAVLGYSVALLFLRQLGAAPEHMASSAWDSNAILAALLVGGLFATPSLLTAALAVLAAVMAAWLALALGRMLEVAQLVPFSAPFVIAAWFVLYAALRNNRLSSSFNLSSPVAPERSHERTRISLARVGAPSSVPLVLPFMGAWTVSQGFSGQYTHRGEWKHALDFIVMKADKSFTRKGNCLDDFYCYNLPVLSPAYGQVWRIVNDVPDNLPGTINVAANWGNFVIIRLYNGEFVMVAHLKPGSICVLPGAWVKAGDFIANCGNSGRSPQPHIHLHLQASDEAGAATMPFHLAGVLLSMPGEEMCYELAVVPGESATLRSAIEGDIRPFYLYAGRGIRYSVAHNESVCADWNIYCEVDELGRLVLVSSRGGRCFVEANGAVFACYERNQVTDAYFDLWLIACGYTPVSTQVESWQDKYIPARLMPLLVARWLSVLLWPWVSAATGQYQRGWDASAQAWKQTARVQQKLTGIEIECAAFIAPQLGCSYLGVKAGSDRYTFQATRIFQRPDIGVPGWESVINY